MRKLLLLIYISCAMAICKAGTPPERYSIVQQTTARDSLLRALHRQIDLLYMKGGEENIKKIDQILGSIADADTTYMPAVLEYAEFLKHHDIARSIRYYQIYMRGSQNSFESYIQALIMLSDAYFRQKMYDKDEEILAQGLQLINSDMVENKMSEEVLNASAKIFSQIAQLYYSTQRYRESALASEKAFQAYELLSEIDFREYLPYYGEIQKIAGDNYLALKEYDKAEELLTEANNKFSRLYKRDARRYCGKYAWTCSSLGRFFNARNNKVKALEHYTVATNLYREAVEYDPDAYLGHLATTLNNYAVAIDSTDFQAKYDMVVESSTYFIQLFRHNPDKYRQALVSTIKNSCFYAINLKKYQEAIDNTLPWIEDIKIYTKNREKDREFYLGNTYSFIAEAYLYLNNPEEALRYIDLALDILKENKSRIDWCVETRKMLMPEI